MQLEVSHKHQLLGIVRQGEDVLINEVICHALRGFNIYELSDKFRLMLNTSRRCYDDSHQFIDWLYLEKYVDVVQAKSTRKTPMRRYRNFPVLPIARDILYTTGILMRAFSDEELAQITTMDVYILSVITDDNIPLLDYEGVPLGQMTLSNLEQVKLRVKKCAYILRELEIEWKMALLRRKATQPNQ